MLCKMSGSVARGRVFGRRRCENTANSIKLAYLRKMLRAHHKKMAFEAYNTVNSSVLRTLRMRRNPTSEPTTNIKQQTIECMCGCIIEEWHRVGFFPKTTTLFLVQVLAPERRLAMASCKTWPICWSDPPKQWWLRSTWESCTTQKLIPNRKMKS